MNTLLVIVLFCAFCVDWITPVSAACGSYSVCDCNAVMPYLDCMIGNDKLTESEATPILEEVKSTCSSKIALSYYPTQFSVWYSCEDTAKKEDERDQTWLIIGFVIGGVLILSILRWWCKNKKTDTPSSVSYGSIPPSYHV